MKRVLWISRHGLTADQQAGLERFCGERPEVICWKENVDDVSQLAEAVSGVDVIAAVLPLHLLAGLVEMAGEKPVLISFANRVLVPTPGPEPEVRFTHGGWQRIDKLQLVLTPVD